MPKKVLITGIAGTMGQLVGQQLLSAGYEVIGIDRRAWTSAPQAMTIYQLDIRKRAAEEVFRQHQPDAVIHLATVTHLTSRFEERYRINLNGTRAIFEYCHQYSVKQAIFVGRHTYYGASYDSPLYHHEDEPPLGATTFPELADLVAADLYAGSALWRYNHLDTAVLRICYTLGPHHYGTLANFLRGPRVPSILGFDPLFQFIHEEDVSQAIYTALKQTLRGVFNVAGPQPVPLSVLIRETGRKRIPVPESAFRLALGRFGLPNLLPGAIQHIKYPIVMDDSFFREKTGFQHQHGESTTMHAYKNAFPVHKRTLAN